MDAAQVNAVIDNLAKKLSVPAGKLMELAPQLGVSVIIDEACGLLAILVLLLFAYMCYQIYVRTKDDGCHDDLIPLLAALGTIISLFLALAMVVVFVVQLSEAVLWWYNHELWMLKYILGALGK